MGWAAFVLWLHLLEAIFWVGGQLFLVLVIVPVARRALAEQERVRIIGLVGRRFAPLSGVALAVLLVTGPINAREHGISWSVLRDTTWGHVLLAKVVLVLIVLVLTAAHGWYFGRHLEAMSQIDEGNVVIATQRQVLRRWSVRLSATNLALNLLIVGLAAWLATLP